jgi:predicted nucleotidyltransferase
MDIEEVKRIIRPILIEYGVSRASVFGSVARGEAGPDSDVDLLVKIGKLPFGIWGFVGFRQELEKAVGRKVDVVSESAVDPALARKIKNDLVSVYERA